MSQVGNLQTRTEPADIIKTRKLLFQVFGILL